MLVDLGFVQLDAETGSGIRTDDVAFLFHGEPLINDVVAPGHIVDDGFANDVARLGETELERRSATDESLGIVRCQPNSVSARKICS